MILVRLLPTEKQTRIAQRLKPYLDAGAIPRGTFAIVARELGVSDAYVSSIFHALRVEGDEQAGRA